MITREQLMDVMHYAYWTPAEDIARSVYGPGIDHHDLREKADLMRRCFAAWAGTLDHEHRGRLVEAINKDIAERNKGAE